jgi:CBS domain containing-hemolysin-like protein
MPTGMLTILPLALVLMLISAFFSGSEAAYFSLSQNQRRSLAKSKAPADRVAYTLLAKSEPLLMGILFWNLLINITYFSLVSRVGLSLQAASGEDNSSFALVTLIGLIAIILFGEFLPKSLAVLYPLSVVRWVAFPLALAIKPISILTPVMRLVTETSRRLFFPGIQPEPYLETEDLNRVVELSTDTDTLLETESQVLQNIIQLKEIQVEEWMRPRTQYATFRLPLDWEQLVAQQMPGGYVLVTHKSRDLIMSYLDLRNLAPKDFQQLERQLSPVIVVPWCATIADTLQRLRSGSRRVAVVVNEYGDAIGVLTWDDIFDAILQLQQGRTQKELARAEIRRMGENRWMATGLTKIRRLERALGLKLEDAESLTVGGLVQQRLRRVPEVGDSCSLGDLNFTVLEAGGRGELLIEVKVDTEPEPAL